jgi:predicted DNA-binding protein
MAQRTGQQVSLYLPAEIAEKLKELSARTEIPQSRLVRQALELLFAKYSEAVPKQGTKVRK